MEEPAWLLAMIRTGHSRPGLMTGHDASRLPQSPVHPNHGPMSKKTTTMPGALVEQGPDAPWLTGEYARLMGSVRDSA